MSNAFVHKQKEHTRSLSLSFRRRPAWKRVGQVVYACRSHACARARTGTLLRMRYDCLDGAGVFGVRTAVAAPVMKIFVRDGSGGGGCRHRRARADNVRMYRDQNINSITPPHILYNYVYKSINIARCQWRHSQEATHAQTHQNKHTHTSFIIKRITHLRSVPAVRKLIMHIIVFRTPCL